MDYIYYRYGSSVEKELVRLGLKSVCSLSSLPLLATKPTS